MNTSLKSLYYPILLDTAWRVLGFGNRDHTSKTFGCFDRMFWHYRMIDYPNSRYQESVYFLALLHETPFDGNIFYKNKNVRAWINAGIAYWEDIQLSDGSFNESYPFEHSFVATAFTVSAISNTIRLLSVTNSMKSLEKSGDWLMRHNNLFVANQMAGAVMALWNIYHCTGKNRFADGYKEKLSRLKTLYQTDGYFIEYTGCDIGYSSILVSYLAQYYEESKDAEVRIWINRCMAYMDSRIDENGNYDFSATSRQTQYLYPYGFFVFNHPVFRRHLQGLTNGIILTPLRVDDRFCIPLAIDYAKILHHAAGGHA
ncbi:MAG: hypothetical protein GF384_03425 [Elusimicrobia bacterium]|nr:hypothetical protein [Elusimicrobiota bacterium]